MVRHRPFIITIAVAAVLGIAGGARALTMDQLKGALDGVGIEIDASVEQAAALAALRTLDEHARFVSPDGPPVAATNSLGTVEKWPECIGYVKVNGLCADAAGALLEHLRLWNTQCLSGVIVDLRGAGGTGLASVDAMAGLFIEEGAELYAVESAGGGPSRVHRAGQPGFVLDIPLVLAVGNDTAGASELLAAVLRGSGGVMLIGAPTAGDGMLRETVPISDTQAIYVATRRIDVLRGRNYHGVGVQPDILVNGAALSAWVPDEADANGGRPLSRQARVDMDLMRRVSGDSVLLRATDVLLGLKALGLRPVPTDDGADVPAS